MTALGSSTRRLLAAAALLVAAVAAMPSLPSGAAITITAEQAATLPTPLPAKGKGWIQGTVVDRAGRAPLGVTVQAFEPGGSTPVATDLTYAGPDVRGVEVDGFYRLVVPAGRYVLKFSTPDRDDPFRTIRDDRDVVEVGRREIVQAGRTLLTLQRRADVTVAADLADRTVRRTRHAVVEAAVTSPDVVPVTGEVEVRHGRKVLAAGDLADGAVELRLPRLAPGTYRLVVTYLGNDHTEAGASQPLSLTVRR